MRRYKRDQEQEPKLDDDDDGEPTTTTSESKQEIMKTLGTVKILAVRVWVGLGVWESLIHINKELYVSRLAK